MRIDRSTLTAEFRSFATEGNGLVIGHPGIGKTYTLLALRDSLKLTNTPHLIVPVESLGDASPPEMQTFLGREGDLIDLLRDSVEPSNGPGILMFDGFDAARGEKERTSILKLIKRAVMELRGSWNVIVSVRTFDAQKSRKLLELFPDLEESSGPTTKCRQFVVPSLRQDELEQAFQQVSGLRALYDQGNQELRALLRLPFNLWLVERVLGVADPGELSRVTSEVQLLDLYWNYRVRQAEHAEQRNYILTSITRRMVEDHTLSVRKDRVYTPDLDVAWNELFSDEVLAASPKSDQRVGFTHNILFDFAVSVHLLENDPEHLAAFIAEEPARPLFLRPSLVYHFTRLWHADRGAFWINFWGVLTREELHLRQIIRLVLPAVVISEAQKVEDLKPLQDRLEGGEPRAVEAVAFIMQALRVLTSGRDDLWAAFIDGISNRLDARFAWDAGLNISSIVTGKRLISGDCKSKCGHFGRQLISWAWPLENTNNRDWLNRLIAFIGVPIVGKTFATDLLASRAVLEPILQLVDRPNFPIESVHRLIDEIQNFCDIDPEFTASIYSKIFGFLEKSEQTTHMGGYVMPMSSNRRQDYDMCRYSLIQVFPRFLASNPMPAIRGGLEAIQLFAIESHVVPYLKQDVRLQDLTKTFRFRGHDSKYLNDGSAIWGEKFNHDQEMQIADMVFQWLGNVAAAERTSDLESFLDFMADKGVVAVLWSRLLNVASKHPNMFASILWELLMAEPILLGPDAQYALDGFLPKAFGYLSEARRRAVEEAILALPKHASEKDREWRERRCNRLLARVDRALLVTPEALQKKSSLAENAASYESDRLFSSTSSFREYTEEDEFKRKGVDLNKEPNTRVREAYLPLKEWADKGKNQDQVPSLLPVATKLLGLLQANSQADPAVVASAWYQLSSFGSDAIQTIQTPDDPAFSNLRQIILLSSSRPEPEPSADPDREWSSPVWSPAPRNESAQILPWLTTYGRDADALAAIDRLTQDPVPSVRFLLYSELWRLHKTSADELWPLLEGAIQMEQNKVVWQGIALSLWRLSRLDKTRTPDLVRQMLVRIQQDADEEDWNAKAQLVGMVADYAVEGASWAAEQLQIWRGDALSDVSSAAVSGNRLIQYIVPGVTGDQLEKAKALLLDHLEGVAAALTRMQKEPDVVPADRRDKTFRKLYGVIDQTISRLYFALDVNPNVRREEDRISDDATRRQLFTDALPLLDKVLSFGDRPDTGFLLAPTAHYFMQLLNGVLRFNPQLVLDRAAKVVKFSKRFNYNLDALALRETVQLVETLLTDYREQIQEGESLQNLLDILDAFTAVGWPDALNLVWRLDEIYR